MTDLILESIRTAIVLCLFVYLIRTGMKRRELCREGWAFIIVGFGLLFFGSLIDITDNFESLNRFIFIGETPLQAFFEKIVGYLCGFLILTVGLIKWMPTIIGIEQERHLNEQLQEEITERKKAEDKLAKAKRDLENVLAAATQISVITVDTAGVIRTWNAGAENMLGYTAEEMVGKQTPDLIHLKEEVVERGIELSEEFDERIEGFDVFVAYAKRGEYEEREWTYVHKNGSHLTVNLNVSAMRDESGQITGFLGIALDITEQKQAEQELKESEERLNALLSNTPTVIYTYKIDSRGYPRLTFLNENVKEVLGFVPDDFIDNTEFWISCVHPEDMPNLQEKLSGKDMTNEYRFKDKAGNYHWLLDNQKVLNEKDGEKEIIGTWRDITERKEMEAELKENQNRLELAMDAGEHGFWDWNLETDDIYFSPRYYTMLGYEPGELPMVKDTWVGLMHPEDRKTIVPKIQKHVENAEPYEVEFRLKCKDGSWKWISGKGKSFEFDENGKSRRAVGVHEDITERKQAEEELVETNKSLEEATAVANSMAAEAERANAAKSEFFANMSHEIRTPLNAVMGMGQLLADTPLNNLQHDYLAKINRSSKLLLGIINDVLDISKIEAGKLELDPHSFNLYDVMNDIRSMFSSSAQQKGLEFIVKADPDIPRALVGDSMRLGQVIANLLSNALKFTESGHISVHINKAIEAAASPDSCRLTFSVTDSGIGMNEEQMGRLFKAFSQADSSTTRKYGGTGLGLVISSRLVKVMGGKLEVTSVEGEGSTFFFTIEFPKASDAVMHTKGKEIGTDQETDSAVTPSFAGYTVLLVEDNEMNQEVAASFITKTTAKIIVAEDGTVALQCYEENNVDLVLMDLQMPVMDGFDATVEIRRRELGCGDDAHVPIIALSAAVLDVDRKKAAKAGADDHLGKPVDPQELYAVMGQYLKSSGTISGEPASTEEEAAEEFPDLDGFDTARGKASAQGKRDTYMKLLRSFNTQITGAFADFPDRISSLTFEEIQHEAHTIKGIAATVGALRVADAAAVIDRTVTEQTAPTESMVNELREALLCAKEQIAPHLFIEKSTVAMGKEDGRKAMDTLLAILRNNELPEDDLIETVVAFVKAQAGSEKADALQSSIEEFDMDTAVDSLEKIQKGE